MSTFASEIERFLAHKRTVGLAYRREESFLKELGRLACSRREGILSEELVREYLSRWSDAGRPNRLTVVRVLARFLAIDEPRTFIPPRRFIGIAAVSLWSASPRARKPADSSRPAMCCRRFALTPSGWCMASR